MEIMTHLLLISLYLLLGCSAYHSMNKCPDCKGQFRKGGWAGDRNPYRRHCAKCGRREDLYEYYHHNGPTQWEPMNRDK